MLTERQKSILDFIQSEQREKGMTPSTREIQKHFRFASQTSVMQYLDALERKGFLDRHARKARALITPAMKVRINDIPIYGQIPAGMVAAEVREMTFLGSLTRVRLSLPDLPDSTGIWADLPSEQADAFRPGSRVLASWDEASPRVMAKAL